MSEIVVTSGRSAAWQRRRRALRQGWADFRSQRGGLIGLGLLGIVVAGSLAAPLIADREMLGAENVDNPLWAPPSEVGPLGADHLGRPVWDQLVFGSRISLVVGVAATVIAVVIGLIVGAIGGFVGGFFDTILSRVTEWFLVIPFVPLAIVLAAVLGPSLRNIVLVIGITSWPVVARLIRAQVLSIKERGYVDRARALGGSNLHILLRHIVPNVLPLVIANATLTVPIAILSETTLAFLGLGDPTQTSWGGMLEEAFDAGAIGQQAWWYYIPPGVSVVVVVVAFTLIGRALEIVLDPRLRERS